MYVKFTAIKEEEKKRRREEEKKRGREEKKKRGRADYLVVMPFRL
jgi:hypothetical protein